MDHRSEGDGSYATAIVDTVAQPLLVLDTDLRVEHLNPAFLRQFQVSADESLGRLLFELGNGQWDIPALRRLLEQILRRGDTVEDYRVEHGFESIGRRVMLLNARRLEMPRQADRILLAFDDVTERERLQHELEGRSEFAEKLIDSVREALLVLDCDLRVKTANQSFYQCFQVDPAATEDRLVYELGNSQWDIPELRRLLEEILPERKSFDDYRMEHDFPQLGRRVMQLNARRLDHLDLILLAIRDVTEQMRGESRQDALMGELRHRVKNILANVGALARQTQAGSGDLDGFMAAFMPRLEALARAQDLLVRDPSEAVDLQDIIALELDAVGAQRGRRYAVEGPPVRLRPQDAQAMAMAVHELTTNAAKYGALAAERDRVEIGWTVERRDAGRQLCFRWQEHGVAIADPPQRRGFGSRIIERSLPYMLGGSASMTFESDGLCCLLDFPLMT